MPEQISEIESEISTIYNRIKEIEAEAEKYTRAEAEEAIQQLIRLRPRLRKLISDASELMEKIPEKKTDLFEKAYDVWSFGKLVEDRLEKLITRLEELEERLVGIPEEEFRGYLGMVETTLTVGALEEKSARFPWEKMSEEQRRILHEAIEKRREEIRLEKKHREIFDIVMEMVRLSETEEQLAEVKRKIEELPIPETMKRTLRSEVERKRKELVPPAPPTPPAPPPVSPEIEKELHYLRVQKEIGMKMHPQIEISLKKLEELGYPEVDEVRRWFL